ncbi:hypothetical protein BDM02DRAFT_3131796 [Thelephora ganbajun]|uniref:Uncharacterized protein n=1 Tax=Thelephora ganbajun TaxID=370292 RepID=A0ACB6Z4U8_THEGA|nr:hypothetical protein BDM02DRAFT_3131796 [Thelephora ganbajun]
MAEPVRPQYPLRRDRENPEHLNDPTSPTHRQHPSGRDHGQPESPHRYPPMSSTRYQLAKLESGFATQLIHHIDGSRFFHIQEREFFSRPTFFRVQIDIDLPDNPQASGGPYMPPLFITFVQEPLPQPMQQLLPLPSTTCGNPTNSLPVAAGLINHHVRQHQVMRHHPYPPPELRKGSPRMFIIYLTLNRGELGGYQDEK